MPCNRRSNAAAPPSHQAGRDRRRFRGAQSQSDRRDRAEQQPNHGAAGGRRVDLTARWRHRNHEHLAGLGHRADQRDRTAHGDRCPPAARAVAVPGRGGADQCERRHRRASPSVLLCPRSFRSSPVGQHRPRPSPLPAVSRSQPPWESSSATIPHAKQRISTRSRRCGTSERARQKSNEQR